MTPTLRRRELLGPGSANVHGRVPPRKMKRFFHRKHSAIGLGYIEDNLMMMLTISSVALAGVVVTLLVRSKIKQKTADT